MANSTNNTPNAVAPAAPPAKKGKAKKTVDPADTAKLVAESLKRLEKTAAGDREEEEEIGMCQPYALESGDRLGEALGNTAKRTAARDHVKFVIRADSRATFGQFCITGAQLLVLMAYTTLRPITSAIQTFHPHV
jgi:hypothetical protein